MAFKEHVRILAWWLPPEHPAGLEPWPPSVMLLFQVGGHQVEYLLPCSPRTFTQAIDCGILQASTQAKEKPNGHFSLKTCLVGDGMGVGQAVQSCKEREGAVQAGIQVVSLSARGLRLWVHQKSRILSSFKTMPRCRNLPRDTRPAKQRPQ